MELPLFEEETLAFGSFNISYQGFNQAILMSISWHNLLIEFPNSVFIKSNLKAFWR